jgi:hypothetical protein
VPDLLVNNVKGDVERSQNLGGNAGVLSQQAEEDVLRADVVAPEAARLLLRQDEEAAG